MGQKTLDNLRAFQCEFAREEATPALAREWLESLPLHLSGDVTLLTHELVVNAMSHTDTGCVWVVVLASPTVIRVQVTNEGRTDPEMAEPEALDECGRGLRWVDALSEEWDLERSSATHVWFQVPRQKTEK